jgi:hypothetical protein
MADMALYASFSSSDLKPKERENLNSYNVEDRKARVAERY